MLLFVIRNIFLIQLNKTKVLRMKRGAVCKEMQDVKQLSDFI